MKRNTKKMFLKTGDRISYNISLFLLASKLFCPGFTPMKENFDSKIRKHNQQIRNMIRYIEAFPKNKRIDLPPSFYLSNGVERYNISIPNNITVFSSVKYYIILFNGNNIIPEGVLLNAVKIIYRVLYEKEKKKGIICYYTRAGSFRHTFFNNMPSIIMLTTVLSETFSQPFGNFDVCSICKHRNTCMRTLGIDEKEIIDGGFRKIQRLLRNVKDTSKWTKTIKAIFKDS